MQHGDEHFLDLDAPPGTVLAALGRAAEGWGASWTRSGSGGRLELPVLAGLRRGFLTAQVEVEPRDDGTHVVLRVEEVFLRVHRPAVVMLLVAALGGMVLMLWPFFPGLLVFAVPATAVGLGAWFLIVSRLQTSGPEHFLESVSAEAAPTAELKER